jgi:hypothetical protein
VTVSSLSDTLLGDLLPAFEAANGGSAVINPGASVTFTVNYAAPVANAGVVLANTITVTAHDDEGDAAGASAGDSATYHDLTPKLAASARTDVSSVSEGGAGNQQVKYTYTLTNTSQASTDPVTVTSVSGDRGSLLGAFEAANGGSAKLTYGACVTFSVTETVPAQQFGTTYTNTLHVSAADDEADPTAASASATISYTEPAVGAVAALSTVRVGEFKPIFILSVDSISYPSFYVNPATGNDNNDGHTPATAWKTWNKLIASVQDGTITGGGWVTSAGLPADLSTVPTPADKEAWYQAYLAGDRIVTGSRIYLDTTKEPLQVTGVLSLPPGCEITSATSQPANLEVNVPLHSTETWFQPDPVDAPDVWETAGTSYYLTGLYEQAPATATSTGGWAQLTPVVGAATLGQAIPTLENTAGSFWSDPAGHLYTHTIAGGNPNTDGIARQVLPQWAENFDGGRCIEVTGGLALNINGDGGFGYYPTTGDAFGVEGIGSGEWLDITVIDDCTWARAGKHTFAAVGNYNSGLTIFHDDTAEQGPGGIFVGYWSHFVDYTSYSGTGSIMTIYDGCQTLNGWQLINTPGGTDDNPGYSAFIAHSNDATESFAERLFENCHFRGGVSLGSLETQLAVMRDCTVDGSIGSSAVESVVERCKIGYRMPSFTGGSALVTDCIIVGGHYYGYPPYIQGSVVFDRCTFDLASNGWSWADSWYRIGPLDLTIENSVILDINNYGYGLIYDFAPSDTVTLDHDVIQGSTDWLMLGGYNNYTQDLTYDDVLNGTSLPEGTATISNTQFVDDAQLDPITYMPAPTSPAVRAAKPEYDVTDYTGQTYAVRTTAGALEATDIRDNDPLDNPPATDPLAWPNQPTAFHTRIPPANHQRAAAVSCAPDSDLGTTVFGWPVCCST